MTVVYRNLFVLCGVLSCIVGVVGFFMPLLPHVPFFLLASWCFAKSSPKLHAKMRSNKYIGKTLTTWEDTQSIPKNAKILAVTMVILSCGVSMFYVSFFLLQVFLVCCAFGVSVYILTRNTAE